MPNKGNLRTVDWNNGNDHKTHLTRQFTVDCGERCWLSKFWCKYYRNDGLKKGKHTAWPGNTPKRFDRKYKTIFP